jgi:hypothetical protein
LRAPQVAALDRLDCRTRLRVRGALPGGDRDNRCWGAGAWTPDDTLSASAMGGFVVRPATYRFTGTVGPETPAAPPLVQEAYRQLAEYLAAAKTNAQLAVLIRDDASSSRAARGPRGGIRLFHRFEDRTFWDALEG